MYAEVKAALVLLVVMLLASCAGRETEIVLARPGDLPAAANVAGVPFFPQADKACGPASLAMALAWTGLELDPESASTQVYTPGREGSLATDMLAGARRNGRLAVPVSGLPALLKEVAAGHPVVVMQNLGLGIHPVWHFAVAIGYDLPAREIVLHSGLDADLRMSLDTFEHTWERSGHWAMVVLPPDRLPAGATPLAVAEAAAGLERVRLPQAAVIAYRTALERWPRDLNAAMGLGNAHYAAGDHAAAAAAFRRATEAHPQSAPAWNNLAHVLLELGEPAEARAAAERAAALAPSDPLIRATLAETATD